MPGLLAGGGMLPWAHTQGSNPRPEQGFPVPSLSESRNHSFGTGRRMPAAHLAAAPLPPSNRARGSLKHSLEASMSGLRMAGGTAGSFRLL